MSSSAGNPILTEDVIPEWRAAYLTEAHLLRLLRETRSLLVRLPLGLGKSTLADKLLSSKAFHDEFDRIFYVAPSWDIIHERALVKQAQESNVPFCLLEARPKERCGSLNEEWQIYERNGCSSYGKAALCAYCPERKKAQPCRWPVSLKKKLGKAKIVFLTEQNFIVNPGFLFQIMFATQAEKILIIFDEGKLSHAPFEVKIKFEEIEQFRSSLDGATKSKAETLDLWGTNLDALLYAKDSELSSRKWEFPMKLNWDALDIQDEGIHRFGKKYRYLGYHLGQFPYSRPDERWKDSAGNLHYILRPYLEASVLVLSAHLDREYVKDRLGLREIASPFDDLRARHSKSRIYNLKSLIGAEKYFGKNHRQILDFFALLIARNISDGRRTLLVVKKKFKDLCIVYLTRRLVQLGFEPKFITKDFKGQKSESPATLPVIHYGIAGINAFEDYDCCYCLSSFYISVDQLNKTLQSNEPETFRVKVKIRNDSSGNRRVEVDQDHAFTNLVRLGNIYLRLLEIDPVLQAVGRVRFFTKPREVIFFQKYDLRRDVGEVAELRTLEQARQAFGLPRFGDVLRARRVTDLKSLIAGGLSMRQAAAQLGIDKSTASRWLKESEAGSASQISSYNNLNRQNETPSDRPKTPTPDTPEGARR